MEKKSVQRIRKYTYFRMPEELWLDITDEFVERTRSVGIGVLIHGWYSYFAVCFNVKLNFTIFVF